MCHRKQTIFQISEELKIKQDLMDKIEIPTQIFMEKVKIPRNCTVCDKIFLGKDNWSKHQIEYHVSGKFEKCNTCYRRFSNKHSLNTHIRETHNVLHIKAKCDICEKVFDNSNKLKIHNNLNHEDKSFKCTICADAFTYKKLLEVHIGRNILDLETFLVENVRKNSFVKMMLKHILFKFTVRRNHSLVTYVLKDLKGIPLGTVTENSF